RKCRKCGIEKPHDEFELVNKERGWRRHECRACTKLRVQDWTARSKEHLRGYQQKYHEEHRDEIIARVNAWVKANPEKRRGFVYLKLVADYDNLAGRVAETVAAVDRDGAPAERKP